MPEWMEEELMPYWKQASNIVCCMGSSLPTEVKHKAIFNQEDYVLSIEIVDNSIELWAIPVEEYSDC
jgi:hypothetical protein